MLCYNVSGGGGGFFYRGPELLRIIREEAETMVDLSRKIKTGAAHAGLTEADIASRMETSPQNFSKRKKTGRFTPEELERLAAAMGAELRLEFVFPDGFTV